MKEAVPSALVGLVAGYGIGFILTFTAIHFGMGQPQAIATSLFVGCLISSSVAIAVVKLHERIMRGAKKPG